MAFLLGAEENIPDVGGYYMYFRQSFLQILYAIIREYQKQRRERRLTWRNSD